MKGWKPLPNERSELGGGGCHMTGKDEYVCPVCDVDDGIYD